MSQNARDNALIFPSSIQGVNIFPEAISDNTVWTGPLVVAHAPSFAPSKELPFKMELIWDESRDFVAKLKKEYEKSKPTLALTAKAYYCSEINAMILDIDWKRQDAFKYTDSVISYMHNYGQKRFFETELNINHAVRTSIKLFDRFLNKTQKTLHKLSSVDYVINS